MNASMVLPVLHPWKRTASRTWATEAVAALTTREGGRTVEAVIRRERLALYGGFVAAGTEDVVTVLFCVLCAFHPTRSAISGTPIIGS